MGVGGKVVEASTGGKYQFVPIRKIREAGSALCETHGGVRYLSGGDKEGQDNGCLGRYLYVNLGSLLSSHVAELSVSPELWRIRVPGRNQRRSAEIVAGQGDSAVLGKSLCAKKKTRRDRAWEGRTR